MSVGRGGRMARHNLSLPLNEVEYAPDLATLNGEITNYERTGASLTSVICTNEAAVSKLAPALHSFANHKTLGRLVGDITGRRATA